MIAKVFFWILLTSLVICGITRAIKRYVILEKECVGYLKRAADANTIPLAKEELTKALKHIEKKGWTSGYTSLLWQTPDEDLGFWYKNLKNSLDELNSLPENASSLEKSNMLMKLRETLIDQTSDGISVTFPTGLDVFPNNWAYGIWGWSSLLLAIVFRFVWWRWDYY
ncbi:MAG: hypothetical protein KC516_02110 [Nanoarchaeota archaeon]|nr:hypothetical protein [Nanoarchaeota archaeon]